MPLIYYPSYFFVITKPEIGGAQKWVLENYKDFKNCGKECFIVVGEEGWLTSQIPAEDILILPELKSKLYLINAVVKFSFFLRRFDSSVVIGNSANAGVVARLSGFVMRSKVLYVSHGWSSLYVKSIFKPLYIFIEKLLVSFTHLFICVSEADKRKAIINFKISDCKIKVLHFKLPDKYFFPGNSSPTSKSLRFLCVSRLEPPKRLDLLLEVFSSAPYELFIVGDGSLLDSVDKEMVTDNVNFLGPINDFDDYHQYDVFILLSDSEGLPISAIQAIRNGLPLVISNVGGCPELISGNGYLVSNDIVAILEALRLVELNFSEMSYFSRLHFINKFMCNSNHNELLDCVQNL